MYVALFLVSLTAAVYAKPSSVEWLDIQDSVMLTYEPYDVTWEQFKLNFGKTYENAADEKNRRDIFMANIQQIEQHNLRYVNGQSSYYQGVNQFSDMTFEEYRLYNNLHSPKAGENMYQCPKYTPSGKVAATVDWRKKGYVTPVKNQGACGSCWAFSTTGSLEGQHFHKTTKLVSLSEQQLVDCSLSFGNLGCGGGLMEQTFEYIKENGGIESESAYPYKAEDEKCHFKKSAVKATVTGCEGIRFQNEKDLKNAVGRVGPISVAIDASNDSFQNYKGGVYDEPDCSSVSLDHGVLAVGYGKLKGLDYWLVKNSWGGDWGMDGYIMMSRNKHNQCGIASNASFPLV